MCGISNDGSASFNKMHEDTSSDDRLEIDQAIPINLLVSLAYAWG